jgi:hypothetical protein
MQLHEARTALTELREPDAMQIGAVSEGPFIVPEPPPSFSTRPPADINDDASVDVPPQRSTHRRAAASLASLIFSAAVLSSCTIATDTGGVMPIGPNTYMVGRMGGFLEPSGSAIKAQMFAEARQYCAARDRVMYPANSTGHDAREDNPASAEVQFLCLRPNDPRLPK